MIRAIVFDLDGTLVDTEPLHFEAFRAVLECEGIRLSPEEYFSRLIGYDDRDCFAVVLREHRRELGDSKLERLIADKSANYLRLIAGRDLLYPAAADFVRHCAARFPLIIATGTLRAEAELILKRAGLRDLFVDVISAEDVEHSKPEPECFNLALGRLGFMLRTRPPIEPAQCLVVEDTSAGVAAARRAGMRVLALKHTSSAEELAEADLIRESLAQTDLDEVLRHLSG